MYAFIKLHKLKLYPSATDAELGIDIPHNKKIYVFYYNKEYIYCGFHVLKTLYDEPSSTQVALGNRQLFGVF